MKKEGYLEEGSAVDRLQVGPRSILELPELLQEAGMPEAQVHAKLNLVEFS